MFWREVFESIAALLQLYGYTLGGGLLVGLVLVAAWLIILGIEKGLERLGIPVLLARIQASAVAFLSRMVMLSSSLARRGWQFTTSVAPTVLGVLGLGLGPWLFVYLLVLDIVKNRAAWAVGATIISLPLCLIGWPVLLLLDKEKPQLSDLPKVVAIAVLWIAPTLASCPIIFFTD